MMEGVTILRRYCTASTTLRVLCMHMLQATGKPVVPTGANVVMKGARLPGPLYRSPPRLPLPFDHHPLTDIGAHRSKLPTGAGAPWIPAVSGDAVCDTGDDLGCALHLRELILYTFERVHYCNLIFSAGYTLDGLACNM